MRVDGAVGHYAMIRVKVLEQLVAREHAARRRSERAQQPEFDGRQIELATVERRAVALVIEREAAGNRHAAPAQDGFHARDQLARAERLADIVVGAEVEANE